MARAGNEDYFSNFKYKVSVIGGEDVFGLAGAGTAKKAAAGFSSISMPSISFQTSSPYREGEWDPMPIKQPGIGEVDTANFQRGVVLGGTPLYEWIRRVKTRDSTWRVDLQIGLMHPTPGQKTKAINMWECYAQRHKPAGDMEGTNSDISIMELDVECEDVTVEELAAA